MRPVTVLELRQPTSGRKLDLWTIARLIERRVVAYGGPDATARRTPVVSIDPPATYVVRWLDDQELYVRVAFHDVALALPTDGVPIAVLTSPDAEPAPLAQEPVQEAPPPVQAPPPRLSLAAEREAILRELAEMIEDRRASL